MASNILDNSVTYASLINAAGAALYNVLKNQSIGTGTYRTNSHTFTIGSQVNTKHHGNQKRTVTITEREDRTESYTTPTQSKIISDIKVFMSGVGVPTGSTNPTPDGAISFFFALNYFVEKAVIKRAITSPMDANSTYHLHYKPPTASSYSKIPYNYTTPNTTTTEKINNIYRQLKTTNLLSDNVRATKIASGAHTSSCSSSSCSSSAFIAYFNLN